MAPCIGLNKDGARVSLDERVVGGLDAEQPAIVDADVPEQMRRQLLVRIEAAVFLHEADTLHLEGGHTAGLFRRRLAPDIDEGAAAADAIGQRLTVLGGAVRKCATEAGRGLARVLDLSRHGINGIGVDAVREEMAAAVEQVAALGRRLDSAHLLMFGARDEIGVLEHLQIDEPRFNGDRPQQKHRAGHGQSALQCCAPRRDGLGRHRFRIHRYLADVRASGSPPRTWVAARPESPVRSPSHRPRPAQSCAGDRSRDARCDPATAASRSRGGDGG